MPDRQTHEDVRWRGRVLQDPSGDRYIRAEDIAALAGKLRAAGYSEETVSVVSWIAEAERG